MRFLRDASDLGDDEAMRMLDALRAAGEVNAEDYDRAQHGLLENGRTLAAARALIARDWPKVGALMNATHDSLSKLYAVSCPELDVMVEIAREQPGCLGARMMGGGFGGCVIVLCEPARAAAVRAKLEEQYPRRTKDRPGCAPWDLRATVFATTPGAGAGLTTVTTQPAEAIKELWE